MGVWGEYDSGHRRQKCPVPVHHDHLKAPDLPELPQAHEAHARKGDAGSHISLHRLRRRGSPALARHQHVAGATAATGIAGQHHASMERQACRSG